MAGNSFGTLFRFTSWGESHGPAIGCVVDGTPPRIPLAEADIQVWMEKRRPGQSRFVTQRQEPDTVKILSGVFEGVTTGTPIALHIDNVDQRSRDYGEIKDQFRPSHADYTYFKKYGVRDYRGGGRQSARETAVRVAAGAIARKILGDGVSIRGAVIQIGTPEDRPRQLGLGRHRRQSLLVPRPAGGPGLGGLSRRRAQARQLVRRGDRGRGLGRAGRPGRSGLRQARRRSRQGADEHQCREGRRDRRRLRDRGHERRGERRRDAHEGRRARLPQQPCRRHPGRHLDRPGHRLPAGREADQFDPLDRAQHRPSSATRSSCAPRAATIPASASAPRRWPRRWWPACWPTICCAIAPSAAELGRMAAQKPVEARYGIAAQYRHGRVVAVGMIVGGDRAFRHQLRPTHRRCRSTIRASCCSAMLAMAMGYYVVPRRQPLSRIAQPQVVIDHDGIRWASAATVASPGTTSSGSGCVASPCDRSSRSASRPRPSSPPTSGSRMWQPRRQPAPDPRHARPPSWSATMGSTCRRRRCLTPCRTFRPNLVKS